jgi:hypothetical protein
VNYTDEQLKRVAERLGFYWNNEFFEKVGREYTFIESNEPTFAGRLACSIAAFPYWLLSPEGRVAIEDKFALVAYDKEYCIWIVYAPDDGSDEYLVMAEDSWGSWIVGEGSTPAEAWLNAAVKFTEGI